MVGPRRSRQDGAPTHFAAKVGISLFGLIFFCFGLVFAGLILSRTYAHFSTKSWVKTPCTILYSQVETVANGYAFKVEYTYRFHGRTYRSDSYQVGSQTVKDRVNEADSLAARYVEDTNTNCYVNPDNPGEAVLKHRSLLIGFTALFPLVFVLVGIWIMYRAWLPPGAREKTSSLDRRASLSKRGRVVQTLFFLSFFCTGLGVGYFWFLPAAVQYFQSDSWLEVPCTVQSSRVQSHDSDDGTTYSVDIVYAYSVQGKEYRSGRYTFLGGSSSGYAGKAAIVRQYPEGKQTTCYINPHNPAEAVLNREVGADLLFGLIPLVFMAVGLIGAIYSIRKGPDNGPGAVSAPSVGRQIGDHSSRLGSRVEGHLPGGQVTLKPKFSHTAKILSSIAGSLVWNGIVSVFVVQAVQSWQAGRPALFLTVFLIPFVVIGLMLIGSIVYFIMASFNPRPVLILQKNTIRLGDRVGLKWHIDGKVSKIQNFQLSLVGEESATYRRGTSTYTDHCTFYDKLLTTVRHPGSMRRGTLTFTVPLASMHSFSSDNNSITWKLFMHCAVPNWPDVEEDFEITVYPQLIEER